MAGDNRIGGRTNFKRLKGVTMKNITWKDKIETFEVMDVRGRALNFFSELRQKAAAKKNGEGLHVVQTFDPVPLYPIMSAMGFEHYTEKASKNEYHAYFYRVKKGENNV